MKSQRGLAAAFGCLVVFLGACASGERDPAQSQASSSDGPVPVVSAPLSPERQSEPGFEHRFLPYIDPADRVHVTYLPMGLEDFAAEAQVLFVGSIADVLPRLATRDIAIERAPRAYVYDGLVFDVEAVLLGEMPTGASDQATFAVEVLVEWEDSARPDTPLRFESLERLHAGLAAAENGAEPVRYLIFAKTTVLEGKTYLRFMGPGSSGLLDGDVVVERGGFIIDQHFGGGKLTLEAVIEWINEGPPPWEPPVSARPDEDAPPGSIATKFDTQP